MLNSGPNRPPVYDTVVSHPTDGHEIFERRVPKHVFIHPFSLHPFMPNRRQWSNVIYNTIRIIIMIIIIRIYRTTHLYAVYVQTSPVHLSKVPNANKNHFILKPNHNHNIIISSNTLRLICIEIRFRTLLIVIGTEWKRNKKPFT